MQSLLGGTPVASFMVWGEALLRENQSIITIRTAHFG
jgi:hypothetical protein